MMMIIMTMMVLVTVMGGMPEISFIIFLWNNYEKFQPG